MPKPKTADAGSKGFSGKPDGPLALHRRVSSTSPNAGSSGRLTPEMPRIGTSPRPANWAIPL
eukprot:2335893-Alexandrium_andersonii.AAC.1